MNDITPSPQQAAAIKSIREWFRGGAARKQVFRVFGFAGTGKTTLTRMAVEELGLRPGEVVHAAYTGKAALVMRRKGIVPASTIHGLIYTVAPPAYERIREIKDEINAIKASLETMSGSERSLNLIKLKHLRLSLDDQHKPRFIINEASNARFAKLIVLDEVSMVGEELASDLLAFERPVLVLGDPGQLPPIKGAGYFIDTKPDVMLTEIHRQAAESAIIRLATMAREGQRIPYGNHDNEVAKLRNYELEPEQFLAADQVICGRNVTRMSLNAMMLYSAGYTEPYPTGEGEKIICLKNDMEVGVVNGMFLDLRDIQDEDDYVFSAKIRPADEADEDFEETPKLPGDARHVEHDEEEYDEDHEEER
jgi:exodeoxyribonuclease-5